MTKLDYAIALAAAVMAIIAAALWLTREPSISLEDAPPAARRLMSEVEDPATRQAMAEGRSIRLRAVKPGKDAPVFRPVEASAGDSGLSERRSEGCGRPADLTRSGSSARPPVRHSSATMQEATANADAAALKAAAAAAALIDCR